MNKNIFIFIFVLWGNLLGAQKLDDRLLTRSFSIKDSCCRVDCKTLIQKSDLKLDANVEYYWIRNNKIQKNKGNFSGSLLHGVWQKYNKNGQLIEKGSFIKGMKSGLWQYWNLEGDLVKSLNYTKGQLNGEAIYYFANGTVEKIPYSKGLIHGKKRIISTDTILIERYRYDIFIPERIKAKFDPLIFLKKKKNKLNEDSHQKVVQT